MADTLFWHNSEVRSVNLVSSADCQVHLTLSAGAIERHLDDDASSSAESGFMGPLDVIFEQAQVTGALNDCMGSITSGEWHTIQPSTSMQRTIPLPWHCDQPLIVHLVFKNGSTLQIEAASARCTPAANARFRESYAC